MLYVGVAIVEVEVLIFLKKVVEVIGELSDSSYQFKLVGWIGWCIQLNTVSEIDVSSLNSGRHD